MQEMICITEMKAARWVRPLEVKSSPRLTANKETATSALPLQGTEFCQQPEWAWKQILPQSLQKRAQAAQLLDLGLVRP